MLPVLLVCAGLIVAMLLANQLSKAGAEPGAFATDDRGFIDRAARCDAPKSAVALGRTEQSLVVICVDGKGHYEYRGMRVKDDYALKVPGAGSIFLNLAVARFCRVLGTLLKNGVPILKSLEISSDSTGNRVLAMAIRDAVSSSRR